MTSLVTRVEDAEIFLQISVPKTGQIMRSREVPGTLGIGDTGMKCQALRVSILSEGCF